MVPLQKVRQKGTAYRVCQRNAQPSLDLLGRLQRSLRLLRSGQQRAGVPHKGLACLRKTNGLAHTVQQRGAQLIFQLGDLGRYSGL